jgi:hypothetical protein
LFLRCSIYFPAARAPLKNNSKWFVRHPASADMGGMTGIVKSLKRIIGCGVMTKHEARIHLD